MKEIFQGKDNDFSIAVCLNAAAGLLVAEKSTSFKDGYEEFLFDMDQDVFVEFQINDI